MQAAFAGGVFRITEADGGGSDRWRGGSCGENHSDRRVIYRWPSETPRGGDEDRLLGERGGAVEERRAWRVSLTGQKEAAAGQRATEARKVRRKLSK